jgi:carbonic anhydrase
MSQILSEVLASRRAYGTNLGDKGKLALPPARRFAILTCMDARPDLAKYSGLAEGVCSGKLIEVEGTPEIGKAA